MPANDEASSAPEIVKATADLLGESHAKADPKADMLLLLLTGFGSIIGALSGAIGSYALQQADPFGSRSIIVLLIWVVVGGAIGCGCCLFFLGARGLIRWEREHH